MYHFLLIVVSFTSIKVRDHDKKAFDRLRHEYALQTGEDLAQHELFHRILDHALEGKKELMRRRTKKRGTQWSKYQFTLKQPTDAASELDEVVYGH